LGDDTGANLCGFEAADQTENSSWILLPSLSSRLILPDGLDNTPSQWCVSKMEGDCLGDDARIPFSNFERGALVVKHFLCLETHQTTKAAIPGPPKSIVRHDKIMWHTASHEKTLLRRGKAIRSRDGCQRLSFEMIRFPSFKKFRIGQVSTNTNAHTNPISFDIRQTERQPNEQKEINRGKVVLSFEGKRPPLGCATHKL